MFTGKVSILCFFGGEPGYQENQKIISQMMKSNDDNRVDKAYFEESVKCITKVLGLFRNFNDGARILWNCLRVLAYEWCLLICRLLRRQLCHPFQLRPAYLVGVPFHPRCFPLQTCKDEDDWHFNTFIVEKSVGTTELHYSTKKREYCFSILSTFSIHSCSQKYIVIYTLFLLKEQFYKNTSLKTDRRLRTNKEQAQAEALF